MPESRFRVSYVDYRTEPASYSQKEVDTLDEYIAFVRRLAARADAHVSAHTRVNFYPATKRGDYLFRHDRAARHPITNTEGEDE